MIQIRRLLLLSSLASLTAIPLLSAQDAVLNTKPSRPKTTFAQKIFIEGGAGECVFPGKLFELESSVKKHPNRLDGSCMFASAGYQLKPTFSIVARVFEQEESGPGQWKRSTGDPAQDAYAATATGNTDVKSSGIEILVRKETHLWKFKPFIEGGGGFRGSFAISFRGVATATDPTSGASFQVPATDHVGRRILIGALGGGFLYPVSHGIELGTTWEWNTGYSRPCIPLFTLHFAPFKAFSRSR